MMNTRDNNIKRIGAAANFDIQIDNDHYVFRYTGEKKDKNAPDLVLEFESDEEHYIEELERQKYIFIRKLQREGMSIMGIGIPELNSLIYSLENREKSIMIDQANMERMEKRKGFIEELEKDATKHHR